MVRLAGQEVTGACKAKAQSGALFSVRSAVVLFYLEVRVTKNDVVVSKGRWELTSMRFELDDGLPTAGN